jgi:hypothetical protein
VTALDDGLEEAARWHERLASQAHAVHSWCLSRGMAEMAEFSLRIASDHERAATTIREMRTRHPDNQCHSAIIRIVGPAGTTYWCQTCHERWREGDDPKCGREELRS